jgi:hypothetical protein
MKQSIINLNDELGKYCIAPEEGMELYKKIDALLSKGKVVVVSFENIVATTAFLRESFGQLLADLNYSLEEFEKNIIITDILKGTQAQLEEVFEMIIMEKENPDEYQELSKSISNILEDDDE